MGKKRQLEQCNLCKHTVDITDKIEIEDYDKSWREGYILVYCDECGSQLEVKTRL